MGENPALHQEHSHTESPVAWASIAHDQAVVLVEMMVELIGVPVTLNEVFVEKSAKILPLAFVSIAHSTEGTNTMPGIFA